MDNDLMASFRHEVLSKGGESTLPCNLNDKWLGLLSAKLEAYIEHEEEDALTLPLAAVLHLLFTKNGGEAVTASLEQLFEHLSDYRIELSLEEIKRKTDLGNDPVSLEKIFTKRTITFGENGP